MFDGPRGSVLEDVPSAVAVSKRRRSPQLVWLIPIIAALVGGGLVVARFVSSAGGSEAA